jgi:transcriptional regulator with GAF, ATPase, and Fis domain
MGGERAGKGKYLLFYLACFIVVIGTVAGCRTGGTISQQAERRSAGVKNPDMRAADLYRQGLILAHPRNPDLDYEKSKAYFQAVLRDFPETPLRQGSETWILTLDTIIEKDRQIEALTRKLTLQEESVLKSLKMNNRLKTQVKNLKSEIKTSQHQIEELKKQIETLKMIDLKIEKKKRKTTP